MEKYVYEKILILVCYAMLYGKYFEMFWNTVLTYLQGQTVLDWLYQLM
jgi:hypothetical protein